MKKILILLGMFFVAVSFLSVIVTSTVTIYSDDNNALKYVTSNVNISNFSSSFVTNSTNNLGQNYIGNFSAIVKNTTWLSFDGTNDFVNTKSDARYDLDLSYHAATFSVWFKLNKIEKSKPIFYRSSAASSYAYVLRTAFADENDLQFYFASSYGDCAISADEVLTETTKWHNAVVTWDLTNISIFFDGNLNVTTSCPPKFPASYNYNSTIGGNPLLGVYFNGSVRDFRFWNSVLTSAQISQLYTNSSAEIGGFISKSYTFPNQTDHTFIPTYDGSNQTIHPSILYFANTWNGWKYWMGNTPLADGSSKVENPSIFVCNDSCLSPTTRWQVPAGLTNPINSTSAGNYHADIDIVYDSTNDMLRAYYFETNGSIITLLSQNSSDGITWNYEILTASWNLSQGDSSRSCSIIDGSDNIWRMWCQNRNASQLVMYYNSTDGLNWTLINNVTFSVHPFGLWHLDVIEVPSKNEYWMMYNGNGGIRFANASTSNPLYFTAYSNFVMEAPNSGWDVGLYRPTFLYNLTGNDDYIHMWHGGVVNPANNAPSYTGYTNQTYNSIMTYLNATNLILRYKFNENNGTIAYDSSGGGLHNGSLGSTTASPAWVNDGINITLAETADYTINLLTGVFTPSSKYLYSWVNLFFNKYNPTTETYILLNNTNSTDSYMLQIYNLTNALIYYSNNSIAGSSNINSNDGDINITLTPSNYSYVLDNFNMTEGTSREKSPVWFSYSDGNIRNISSNLTDTINNLTVIINTSVIPSSPRFTSHTGAYNKTYSSSEYNYNTTTNLLTLNISGIETASGSNQLLIDTIAPSVTINSPTATTYTTSQTLFNVTLDDNGTCLYSTDSGITNYTMNTTDNRNFNYTKSLGDGSYTAKFYCNDTAGNRNDTMNVSFSIDIPTPATSLSGGGGLPVYTINKESLSNGYTKSLGENWKFNFNINNKSHELKVKDINYTSKTALISISSEKQEKLMSAGEEWKVELTNDSYYDLYVKLNSITSNLANLTLKSVYEKIETEEGQNALINNTENMTEYTTGKTESLLKKYWIYIIVIIIIAAIALTIIKSKKRYKN
ncbi:MAG: LamG domain-containing protein [Candidatus Nanoarchaeia archaeon]|nr:LamG domain-containing protein [Candidatus Nanoarchaeia archaeon]MDD5741298.1 LamG domain-containing protein [Candidatus Nanoarchaeia archaeon]